MLSDGLNMLARILRTLGVRFGIDHIGIGIQRDFRIDNNVFVVR